MDLEENWGEQTHAASGVNFVIVIPIFAKSAWPIVKSELLVVLDADGKKAFRGSKAPFGFHIRCSDKLKRIGNGNHQNMQEK